MVNVGHEEVIIIKGHTLAYLTPVQYDNLSVFRENDHESVVANISAVKDPKVEILPDNSICNKMIFPGNASPLR